MTDAELRAIERQCEAIMDSDIGPDPSASREALAEYEAMIDIIDEGVPRLIAAVRKGLATDARSAALAEAGMGLRRDVAEQWGEGDATAAFDATLRQVMSAVEATP